VHCGIFCSYQSLWDGPVALVAYSFGGLVLKSLVVEAHKRVYQRPKNGLDDEVQKCCKTFLNNVKGVVFYGVPHFGGTQYLSKYFTWQCQQINTFNKYATQPGFSKNLKPFNLQMEYLSNDFKNATHADLNIYAFGEGLPIDKDSVRFSFYHTESYPLVEHFLYCQNLCGIMYSILLNILLW
jgi:hypothetical protein